MILFESPRTFRFWEYSYIRSSLLLRSSFGTESFNLDLMFWGIFYLEIIPETFTELTIETLTEGELEALESKVKSGYPNAEKVYFALSSGGKRWYIGAEGMRHERNILSIRESNLLTWNDA